MSGKLVILGATGGLGGRLAHYFHKKNYAVLAVGRNLERLSLLKSIGISGVQGEIDSPEVLEAVTKFAPDAIINAAGKSGFSRGRAQYHTANIETVENAIFLARAAKNCRLIHFSSPSVSYRAHDCFGITEDKPFSPPVSGYAWSRQQSELILSAVDDLPVTMIRLRSTYGYGAVSPLQSIRNKIIARSFLPWVRGGQVAIDLIHIDDLVEAVEAVVHVPQKTGPMVLNVAGPEALTFKRIADGIAAYERTKPKWLPVPGIALAFAGPIAEIMMLALNENREPDISAHMAGSLLYSQTLDLSKIKSAIGWSPRFGFEDVLSRKAL